ncbi:uncharacterized protein BYT42DRAFT_208234 [Radiomyces spectabilis]|uniref:uncharacterized protein n=1 Tax=Radiomyces spectabilis TaxID=64574 RepID=UPI002220643A|nr:uncharacterized protein BYT42DRAFT_208234 [Radiomyces spectabilis]KAI8391777.1 hypothetical protein BYT42DRAFT_208234 [Radiomyces spectabilis]
MSPCVPGAIMGRCCNGCPVAVARSTEAKYRHRLYIMFSPYRILKYKHIAVSRLYFLVNRSTEAFLPEINQNSLTSLLFIEIIAKFVSSAVTKDSAYIDWTEKEPPSHSTRIENTSIIQLICCIDIELHYPMYQPGDTTMCIAQKLLQTTFIGA